MIRILDYEDARPLLTRKTQRLEEAERVVTPILADVRNRGDAALLEYARKFDGFEGVSVRLPITGSLQPQFEEAVRIAAANIREYACLQLPQPRLIDYPDGRKLGQIVRPLDSMGAYTPAGRYPLPSTLLMNVIPAQVAGVKTTCVACPRPSPEIMGIAAWLGVTHFFQMGERRPSRRWRTEPKPCRASTVSWDRGIFTSPPLKSLSPAKPESTSLRDRPKS